MAGEAGAGQDRRPSPLRVAPPDEELLLRAGMGEGQAPGGCRRHRGTHESLSRPRHASRVGWQGRMHACMQAGDPTSHGLPGTALPVCAHNVQIRFFGP